MEEFIAEVCPTRSCYQDDLKVPNSVLDECQQSFTAGDKSCKKASTQCFDSIALMGMLCRHDRVLWLVNMTSAGKQQHYALTLIDTLFKHLPPSYNVGILYDIACTLKCSCLKWGFLDQYIDRISFAISVFHAYGHAWVFQCVYHPCKCDGFGLTDGEGCKRFWHSISKLVVYLSVCGVSFPLLFLFSYWMLTLPPLQHHTRLYTLDSQIQHADRENLIGLGKWLACKWCNAKEKRTEAKKDISESQESPDFLQLQWKAQVAAQTKPSPSKPFGYPKLLPSNVLSDTLGESKATGKTAIEEAIRLGKVHDSLVQRISKLDDIICDENADVIEYTDTEEWLPGLRKQLDACKVKLLRSERGIGLEDWTNYCHLINSPDINLRMNACMVKMRLQDKL